MLGTCTPLDNKIFNENYDSYFAANGEKAKFVQTLMCKIKFSNNDGL